MKDILLFLVLSYVLCGCGIHQGDSHKTPSPSASSVSSSSLHNKGGEKSGMIPHTLVPHRRKAWKPVVKGGNLGLTKSRFSGTAFLKKDGQWPHCKNCKEPMQLFLQLNIEELPPAFKSSMSIEKGLLQLFYCITMKQGCECATGGWEPFAKTQLARIIEIDDSSRKVTMPSIEGYFPAKTIVGWKELDDYPHWEEMDDLGISLSPDEEKAYDSLEMPLVGDKLGGWPAWVQGVEYPQCPVCRKKMRYLFQIESEDNLPYMFGDAGCGHITQCSEHRDVITFTWACH